MSRLFDLRLGLNGAVAFHGRLYRSFCSDFGSRMRRLLRLDLSELIRRLDLFRVFGLVVILTCLYELNILFFLWNNRNEVRIVKSSVLLFALFHHCGVLVPLASVAVELGLLAVVFSSNEPDAIEVEPLATNFTF